jgi:predicted ribosome quality control (RQC) complex YloA/Tae2 family protein
MITLSDLQNLLAEKQELLESKRSTLDNYKHDPLAHFEDEIKSDHDSQLRELYAHVLDQLPFYVCGRGAASFADWVSDCDQSFYDQSLNDFADSYDVENFDEYKDLESEIEELESEISDLEDQIEEWEEFEKVD